MNNFGKAADAGTTVTAMTAGAGRDEKTASPKGPLPVVVIKLMLDPNKLLTREDAQALAPGGGDTVILVDGAAPDYYLRRESRHKSVNRKSELAKVIYGDAPNGLPDTEHMIIPTHAGEKIKGVTQNDFVATVPGAVGSQEDPKPRLDEPFNIYKNASQHIQNAFALVRAAGYRVIIIPYYKPQGKDQSAKPKLAFNTPNESMEGVIKREINRLTYDLYKTHIKGRGFYVGQADLSHAIQFAYTNFLHKVDKLKTFLPGTYDPAKVVAAHRRTGGGETILAMRGAKSLQLQSSDTKAVALNSSAAEVSEAQQDDAKEVVTVASGTSYAVPFSPARAVAAHSSVLQPISLASLRQPLLGNDTASATGAIDIVSYGSVGAKAGFTSS